jgi:hypothetical protein
MHTQYSAAFSCHVLRGPAGSQASQCVLWYDMHVPHAVFLRVCVCLRLSQVRFRPYDLVVVNAKEVQAEHFTMSSSGVVHMRPDGPSEFLSVSDWMREASQFNIIASMYRTPPPVFSIPTYRMPMHLRYREAWQRHHLYVSPAHIVSFAAASISTLQALLQELPGGQVPAHVEVKRAVQHVLPPAAPAVQEPVSGQARLLQPPDGHWQARVPTGCRCTERLFLRSPGLPCARVRTEAPTRTYTDARAPTPPPRVSCCLFRTRTHHGYLILPPLIAPLVCISCLRTLLPQSIPFMDFKGTRYDIDQFQELQNECRAEALKRLETITSKVLRRPR